MNIDAVKFLSVIIEAFSFISAFAAIVGGVIMLQVMKKFGSGILTSGFRSIAFGVLFIAVGIFIDAVTSYFHPFSRDIYLSFTLLIKGIFYVLGTYIIVIGSKKTVDKLESIMR